MKKMMSPLLLSLGSFVLSSTAFATPARDLHHNIHDHLQTIHKNAAQYHADRQAQYDRYQEARELDLEQQRKQQVNPNRDWYVGQTFPRRYHTQRYEVSKREERRLPTSIRAHQWYKVNGDYILVSERTYRIVRIING